MTNQPKFQDRPKRETECQVLFTKFKPEKSNLKAYRTLIRFFLNANQQKHIQAPFTLYVNQLPKAIHRKLMLCPKKIMPGYSDEIPVSKPAPVPISTAVTIPNAAPVPNATRIPTATKRPSTTPTLQLTSSTRRIFRQTKPTSEPNPIPVSIPTKRPIVTKSCRVNSKFFYEEMVFYF